MRNKRVKIIFIAFMMPFGVLAQCFELQNISNLFDKDLEGKDSILEKRGYKLSTTVGKEAIVWSNKESNNSIAAVYYEEKELRYMVFALDYVCYGKILEGVRLLRLKKDLEVFENKVFHYFYSSNKYHIELRKGSDEGGKKVYSVSIFTAVDYYERMAELEDE